MTPDEFQAARRASPLTDAELAAFFDVDVTRVADWSTGRRPIPRIVAEFVATDAAMQARDRALSASGLPERAPADMVALPPTPRERLDRVELVGVTMAGVVGALWFSRLAPGVAIAILVLTVAFVVADTRR